MKYEKKEINVQIGERVRTVRTDAGLTQESFAELLDVSTQYISDLERGVVGISVATLKRLCETFSVSSDAILLSSPRSASDACKIADKISRLSPEQAAILNEVVNHFIEAIATAKNQ